MYLCYLNLVYIPRERWCVTDSKTIRKVNRNKQRNKYLSFLQSQALMYLNLLSFPAHISRKSLWRAAKARAKAAPENMLLNSYISTSQIHLQKGFWFHRPFHVFEELSSRKFWVHFDLLFGTRNVLRLRFGSHFSIPSFLRMHMCHSLRIEVYSDMYMLITSILACIHAHASVHWINRSLIQTGFLCVKYQLQCMP